MEAHATAEQWLQRMRETANDAATDCPNYWIGNPNTLISCATLSNLCLGTGHSIFENSILPAIETAEREVILVTCFWARSATLDALDNALGKLSSKATSSRTKIRVRICFSSSSLFQKLFHPSSVRGRTHRTEEWQKFLGLPSSVTLSGLDMEVKSVFALPFSVMHPKFVIIDRKRVLLPSCNVSWENWFEGCVDLSGPVTEQFVEFWRNFWASEEDGAQVWHKAINAMASSSMPIFFTPQLLARRQMELESVPCLVLPSPHHRNPNFALPWRTCRSPPSTPLNLFLLSAFHCAKNNIYIQTPNLTAPPVLTAIFAALKRGVHLTIMTSERLMILEQILTAGTTTSRCVRMLIRRYSRYCREQIASSPTEIEAGHSATPGKLRVRFFQPHGESAGNRFEPTQSHLKLMIVDDEWTVLGSGNMDRASWYTSQELGVAFLSAELATEVRTQVDALVTKRSKCVFDSERG